MKIGSKITILAIIIICGWYGKNLDTWGKNKVIQNDVISYYAYLPAALIFNDLNFDFTKNLPENFEGTIWLNTSPTGKPVLKMTMGLSVAWLPFFLFGHALAHLSGTSALGYSWPYGLSIFLAALFYLGIGLFFLAKILQPYFSEITAIITLLVVVLATNLIYYVISEPGMSHVVNFGLITGFLYFTLRWVDKPKWRTTVLLGALAGLITLIRPVNVIVILSPLLIGVSSLNTVGLRLQKNWKKILAAAVIAFLVILPQLLYWKAQTGQFVFNSYMEEGFYFNKPHILNGLISYRKGWLVYTPVMIFALIGFFWIKKYSKKLFLPVLIFVLLDIYVVYSWWCWWYGGSFGSRPMIDIYGILAIPLAAFIQRIWESKNWQKGILVVLLAAFIWLNQFQMSQYRSSLLHWDSMTKEAYWGIFGRKTWPQGYDKMIKVPDYEKAVKGEKEY